MPTSAAVLLIIAAVALVVWVIGGAWVTSQETKRDVERAFRRLQNLEWDLERERRSRKEAQDVIRDEVVRILDDLSDIYGRLEEPKK